MRDILSKVMTGSMIAGAALLVTACGGGSEANNTADMNALDSGLYNTDGTVGMNGLDTMNGADMMNGTDTMNGSSAANTTGGMEVNTTANVSGGNMSNGM